MSAAPKIERLITIGAYLFSRFLAIGHLILVVTRGLDLQSCGYFL